MHRELHPRLGMFRRAWRRCIRYALRLSWLAVLMACHPTASTNGEVTIRTPPDTLISVESGSLAEPAGLAVGRDGAVYVLDSQLERIVVWRPGGGALQTIGHEGHGPGELEQPSRLVVSAGTVWVANTGNGRLDRFTRGGQYIGSTPLPTSALSGAAALDGDGRIAVPTGGVGDTVLAVVYRASGRREFGLGALIAPSSGAFDLTAIHNAIAAGRVPALFRNFSLPLFGRRGGVWLILLAEGVVQRYDSVGQLQWSARLRDPELARIREEFFATSSAAKGPTSFRMFSYVADAAMVGDCAWLLLNSPQGDSATILVIGPDGSIVTRITAATVHDARGFAVDEQRRRLYMTVPSRATLLAVPLPAMLPGFTRR